MADENKSEQESKKSRQDEGADRPTALGGMVEIFRANIGDTVAYLIMALGLVLCFFEPFAGSLPVGFVMGLYFSKSVFAGVAEFKDFLVSEGIFRGFIIIASLVALAISAPGLCLGIFLGALARPLFGGAIHDHEPQDKQ